MNMINHTMMREVLYEPESRNEHGYNDDVYEPMHTKRKIEIQDVNSIEMLSNKIPIMV